MGILYLAYLFNLWIRGLHHCTSAEWHGQDLRASRSKLDPNWARNLSLTEGGTYRGWDILLRTQQKGCEWCQPSATTPVTCSAGTTLTTEGALVENYPKRLVTKLSAVSVSGFQWSEQETTHLPAHWLNRTQADRYGWVALKRERSGSYLNLIPYLKTAARLVFARLAMKIYSGHHIPFLQYSPVGSKILKRQEKSVTLQSDSY